MWTQMVISEKTEGQRFSVVLGLPSLLENRDLGVVTGRYEFVSRTK